MMSCAVIFHNCVSVSSMASMGTWCLPCYTGGTLESSMMDMRPILSKNLGTHSLDLLYSGPFLFWSGNGETVAKWFFVGTQLCYGLINSEWMHYGLVKGELLLLRM